MAERNEEAELLRAELDGYREGVCGLGQKPPSGFVVEDDFGVYRRAHIEGAGVREAIYQKGKRDAENSEDRVKLAKAAADACRAQPDAPPVLDDLIRRVTKLEGEAARLDPMVDRIDENSLQDKSLHARIKQLEGKTDMLETSNGLLTHRMTKLRRRVTKFLKGGES